MLLVNIAAENSRFNQVINESSAKIQAFSTQVTASFSAMAQGGIVFAAADRAVTSLVSGLSQIPAAMQAVVSAAADMETQVVSFEVLLGSVEAARQRMEELAQFAASTPFELPEVAAASRTLQTLTRGALATGEGLRLVGDVAAGTGRPFSELAVTMGRLYDALQSGRPAGEAMARLQELGVISGATRAQLEAMQQTGAQGPAIWQAAADAMSGFDGMMARQSATWNGLISTVGDASAAIQRAVGEPLLAALKPILADLITTIEGFVPAANAVGRGLALVASSSATLAPMLVSLAGLAALNRSGFLAFAATGPTVGQSMGVGLRSVAAVLLQVQAQVLGLRVSWISAGAGFGQSLAVMRIGLASLATSVAASARAILSALGPVNIAIMAATAGYAALMNRASRIDAATDAVIDIGNESGADHKEDIGAMRAMASERERADLLARLEERLEKVRERTRNVSMEFRNLDDEGIDRVREALEGQARTIEMTIRSAQRLSGAYIEANAAARQSIERTTAALEDQAKAQAKMVSDRADALQRLGEADAGMALSQAETPEAKRQIVLKQAGAKSPEDVQARIDTLQSLISTGNASTVPAEIEELNRLITARETLLSLDQQIASAAKDRAENEAKKNQSEAERLAKAKRDAEDQIAMLEAELSGDPRAVKAERTRQRRDSLRDGFLADGMSPEEADSKSKRIADLEAKRDTQSIGQGGPARAVTSLAKIGGAAGYNAAGGLQREANSLLKQVVKGTGEIVKAVANSGGASPALTYG